MSANMINLGINEDVVKPILEKQERHEELIKAEECEYYG